VDLPYSHVINYLKILDLVFEDDVAQRCWSILNDMYVYFPHLISTSWSYHLTREKKKKERETDIRLLTPLYTIHPPNTLACAAILLTTRLKRIPLPADWFILFDVTWDDIWSICGAVMTLWNDWGISGSAGDVGDLEQRVAKENRWRRSWILAQSRRAVRRWVQERDGIVAS
jgi:hypothetical protein